MRFISHHEIEQRLAGDEVRTVIVCKFGMGDLVCPGTRVGPTEDLKVCRSEERRVGKECA